MTDEEREMIRGWLIDYATLDEKRGYVLTYPQLVSKLWGLVKRDPAPEVVLVEAPKGQTLEEWQEEMAELRQRAREAINEHEA